MHHTKNAPASSISCLMSSAVAKGYGLASLLGNLGKVHTSMTLRSLLHRLKSGHRSIRSSAGAEHVTAIAHIIVRHEQLTGLPVSPASGLGVGEIIGGDHVAQRE